MTTKAQARKNLKKAAKAHKEKVRQPVTIEFQEEHLSVIIKALEVYTRLKLGQIDYALEEAFGWELDRDKVQAIHNYARQIMFEGTDMERNPNVSWGIYNQEKVGDATLGYEVQKVLGRYRAITNNDGWSDWGRSFDKPFSVTGVPLPEVQNFIDYKLFKIPKKLWKSIANAIENKDTADWNGIWKSIDKAMPNLPKGEKSEIICSDFISDGYSIKVTAPIKPKEERM
jgi:hypothetical protein